MNDRPRPTPELLARLREGKRALHAQQRGEKLESWQRPWDIEP